MSDANTLKFQIIEETTAGTTPGSGTVYTLNHTGADVVPAYSQIESATIRSNRNPPGAKLVGPGASGRVPFELQYDDTLGWWKLLAASIQTDADTAAQAEVSSVTATASGGTLAATGVGTNVEVGDVVMVRTSADALVGYYRVTVSSANSITVEGGLADGSSLKVRRGQRIKNGSTQKSWTMLQAMQTANAYNRHQRFQGAVVDGCSLEFSDKAITTGAFPVVGRGAENIATADPFASGYTVQAAPTTEVMDSTNNVPVVRVAATDFTAQSVSLNWVNGSAPRSTIGQFAASGIRSGTFRGSGQITAYFDNFAEYNKALAGTLSALLLVSEDSAGNALAFSVPSIRYGNPTTSGKAQDQDIMANLPFTFEENATESVGIRILAFDT